MENVYRGAVCVITHSGDSVLQLGDTTRACYPRSAIKPLQAIPLVESGAAQRLHLSDAEICLACASHSGETTHIGTAKHWLEKLAMPEHALRCGATLPLGTKAAETLLRNGQEPSRLHNNCSGKHLGFLSLSQDQSFDITNYLAATHPTQCAWRDILEELAQVTTEHVAVDGCGIPTYAVPLSGLALAMAKFSRPQRMPGSRGAAIQRITAAIQRHPQLLAGSGRLCSILAQHLGKRVIAKVGADGVYAAALPEQGMGIAIKIDDGSRTAAELTLVAVLLRLNIIEPAELSPLQAFIDAPILNSLGANVGKLSATL